MSLSIKVEVEKKVKAIDKEMKARAVKGTLALKNAELRVLRGQRGGRKYKKSFKGSHYTASAPGEPPAVRTGNLRSSFRPIAEKKESDLSVTIGIETQVEYAGYLEHGTKKMAARPYVEKIKQEALPEIKQIYGEPYNV